MSGGALRVKSIADLGKHVRVAGAVAPKQARSKYGAEKTDGFASKREANKYTELRLREQAGEIADLRTQVSFDLCVSGVFICRYIADFTWIENGKTIVADAKGAKTPVYAIKKKLMRAVHDIEIVEL